MYLPRHYYIQRYVGKAHDDLDQLGRELVAGGARQGGIPRILCVLCHNSQYALNARKCS